MIKRKYAKCAGCVCLKEGKTEDDAFFCTLGHKIEFGISNGKGIAPKPEEECRKPKDDKELKEIKERYYE